jgi:hypothetical protein
VATIPPLSRLLKGLVFDQGSQDISRVRQELEACRSAWDLSEEKTKVMQMLGDQIATDKASQIDQVVCLALGHMRIVKEDDPEGCWRNSDGPRMQHIFACEVGSFLESRKSNRKDVSLYAQDPNYSPNIDKVVLSKSFPLPFTIQDHPKGLLKIDNHTLVICIYANEPLLEVVADVVEGDPIAIIINQSRVSDEYLDDLGKRGVPLKSILGGYKRTKFEHVIGKTPHDYRHDPRDATGRFRWLSDLELLIREE